MNSSALYVCIEPSFLLRGGGGLGSSALLGRHYRPPGDPHGLSLHISLLAGLEFHYSISICRYGSFNIISITNFVSSLVFTRIATETYSSQFGLLPEIDLWFILDSIFAVNYLFEGNYLNA